MPVSSGLALTAFLQCWAQEMAVRRPMALLPRAPESPALETMAQGAGEPGSSSACRGVHKTIVSAAGQTMTCISGICAKGFTPLD